MGLFDDRDGFNRLPQAPSLVDEARAAGHPDPEHATWGEVNCLGVASFSAGRRPSREEAREYLDYLERISDFEDTMRG